MPPFDDFQEQFSEVYFGLANEFNIDPEITIQEKPEIERKARGNPTGLSYNSMENTVYVDPAAIEMEMPSDMSTAELAGSVAAEICRGYLGSGDDMPVWSPEKQFFSTMGVKYALDNFDLGGPEVPEMNTILEIPEGVSVDESLKLLAQPEEVAKQRDVPMSDELKSEMQSYWMELSAVAGGQKAVEEYDKATDDEQLVYWPSKHIREKYGIDERLSNLVEENMERY
ncbi:MAG: hypothetical protein ABEK16_05745 [Candidatus Nanohalobium sp.]